MPNTERANLADERNVLLEILGGEPQVLYIESGGIKPSDKPSKKHPFETTSYADETVAGTLGGKARIIAAAEIARIFPNIVLVTTSREDTYPETHAKVMADELVSKYGVSRNRIELQEISISTKTELTEMVKMAIREHWQSVAVLVNDYHIARNMEMFAHLDELAEPNDEEFKKAWEEFQTNVRHVFVGAETLLPLKSPKYEKLIKKVYKSKGFRRRRKFEKRGIRAIREGTYEGNPTANVLLKP